MNTLPPEIANLKLLWHYESIGDAVYAEGYADDNHFASPWDVENPYPFPHALTAKRNKISVIYNRLLTNAERKKLQLFNEKIKKTKWDRWASGNYYRHCVEPMLGI